MEDALEESDSLDESNEDAFGDDNDGRGKAGRDKSARSKPSQQAIPACSANRRAFYGIESAPLLQR